MPEQDIKYRVSIDDNDLSQRLTDIRNEIDAALSVPSYTTGDYRTVFASPSAGLYPSITATPPGQTATMFTSPTAGIFPSVIAVPPDQTYATFTSPTANLFPSAISTIDQTTGNITDATRQAIQQTQQTAAWGFGRTADFFNQAYMTAANTFNRIPHYQSIPISPGQAYPGFTGEEGWFRATAGALGLGYDPRSILTREEYRQTMQRRMAYTFPGAAGTIIGGTIGAAVGTALLPGPGSILGAIGGGFVGETLIGGGLNLFYGPTIQDMQTADYANYMQIRTLGAGQMGPGFGTQVADRMREFARSRQAALGGFDRTEVEGLLAQFTNLGGFDTARSADEYLRRFDDMLDGHRRVMHALRLSSEKALQFMATLETTNLVGVAPGQFVSYDSAAQLMRAAGTTVGLPAGEMAQYGMQSMQLGTQLMPGITFAGAFTGGMATLIRTQQLARAGFYGDELLAQLGGAPGIATTLQQIGYRYAQSPMGRMALLAGPGGLGQDIIGMTTQGMGRLNTMEDIIRFQAGMNMGEQMQEIGPVGMMGRAVKDVVELMRESSLRRERDGKFDLDLTAGMLRRIYPQLDLDPNQARAMIRTVTAVGQTPEATEQELIRNLIQQQLAERPTQFQETIATLQQTWGNIKTDILRPVGVGAALALPFAAAGAVVGGPVGAATGALTALVAVPAYSWLRGPRGTRRDYESLMGAVANLTGNVRPDIDIGALTWFGQLTAERRVQVRGEAGTLRGEILESYDPSLGELAFGRPPESDIVIDTIGKRQAQMETVIRQQLEYMEGDLNLKETLGILNVDLDNLEAVKDLSQKILRGDKIDPNLMKLLIANLDPRKGRIHSQEELNRLISKYQVAGFLEAETQALKYAPTFLQAIGFTKEQVPRTGQDLSSLVSSLREGRFKLTEQGQDFQDLFKDKTQKEAELLFNEVLLLHDKKPTGTPIGETLHTFKQIENLSSKVGDNEVAQFLANWIFVPKGSDPKIQARMEDQEVSLVQILSQSERASHALTAKTLDNAAKGRQPFYVIIKEDLSK